MDEHLEAQPLSDFRIIDLTHGIAGPYCTKLLADYGADPWKLEPPDIDALVTAVEKVRSSYDRFSAEARKVALERFSTQKMANAYAQVIRNAVGRS